MFLINMMMGKVDEGTLARRASPLIEAAAKGGNPWKDMRKDCESIFAQVSRGAQKIDMGGAKQYFKLVGNKHFGQDLSSLLSPRLFDRFDFEGDGTLDHTACFRALRKSIMERCTSESPSCPTSTVEAAGYQKIKVLAKGGQGAAWLGKVTTASKGGLSPGQELVLKEYSKGNANAGGLQELIDEYSTMRLMDKSSLVMTAYEIFQDQNSLWCVNELCAGGDLASLRKNCAANWVNLSQAYWQFLFKQCLDGVETCHKHGIMHCDIKEPNIMLKTKDYARPSVIIIDLGMAQATASSGMAGGTPGYRPPETNANNVWMPKGDIFALGVSFFQLLSDKVPDEKTGKMGIFQEGARSINDVYAFTAQREPPWGLIQSMPWAQPFLKPMLEKDEKKRWRAYQCLNQSEFFRNAQQNPDFGSANSGVGGCFQC